jgi:O-antigen ligase
MYKNLANKYFFILFSILPITIIVGPMISLINVLIIGLSFLIYTAYIKEWSWLRDKKIQLLFILYFYLIFNSFIAENFSISADRNFGFIRFIIFFAAFNYFFFNYKSFYKIFIIWTIVIVAVVLDIYYESFVGHNIIGFGSGDRIFSFFNKPIAAGYLISFYLIIISFLFEFFKNKNHLFKYLIFFISIVFLLSIVITGERSNTIKAILVFIFFYTFIKNFSFKQKAISIIGMLLIVSAVFINSSFLKMRFLGQFLINFQTKDQIISFYNKNIYFNLYRSGVEVFKKYPYFGAGNKNYGFETCWDKFEKETFVQWTDKYLKQLNEIYNPKYVCNSHPHQIYFEFLAEHGILGTIICLFIFFKLFFDLLRKIDITKNLIQFASFLYIFTIFIPMLPSGAFFSDSLLTLFFINFSLLFCINEKSNIFIKKN